MKHVVVVRADYYKDLEKSIEEKIQELQNTGNDIVSISVGGRGNESLQTNSFPLSPWERGQG